MNNSKRRSKLLIARIFSVLLLGSLVLPGFAQETRDDLFLSGPNGTAISLVFNEAYFDKMTFNPEEKVTIYKSKDANKKRQLIAEVRFPASAEEFSERLGKENMQALMENLEVNTKEALYQKVVNQSVDSLGLNLFSPELQEAVGLYYLDETWKQGEAVFYEVEKVDASGNSIQRIEHTINGGMFEYSQKFTLSNSQVNDSLARFTWSVPENVDFDHVFPVLSKLMEKKDLDAEYKMVAQGMPSPSMNGDSSHVLFRQKIKGGEAYSFYSVLYDVAGNESPPSDTVNILSVSSDNIALITEFRAKQDSNVIALTWNQLPKKAVYTGIEISKTRSKESSYVILDTIDAQEISYQDKQILKGSAYYYRIRPLLLVQNESASSEYAETSTSISYSKGDAAPSKPQGLRVEPNESGIRLSWWSPDETDIFGYYVLRGTNEKTMETIGEIVQDTVFIDGAFPSDFSGDIKYALLAMNQNQQLSDTSDISALSIRQELVLTPASGLATVLTDQGVALRWNDVTAIDDRVSSYLILRRKKGEEKYDVIETPEPIDVPFYTHVLNEESNTDRSAVYEYAIATQDLWGNFSTISNSSEVDFSSSLQMTPPSEVILRSLSSGIEVSWPSPFESGDETYIVYRKAEGEKDFQEIGKARPTDFFMDTTTQSDILYEYSVAIHKQNVEGEKSTSASIRK